LSIANEQIVYAHVCRVERLQRDLVQVGEIAGRKLLLDEAMPHFNKGPRAAALDFAVSPAQRHRIEQLYAADFEAFGY
jgi:hypothetical protein